MFVAGICSVHFPALSTTGVLFPGTNFSLKPPAGRTNELQNTSTEHSKTISQTKNCQMDLKTHFKNMGLSCLPLNAGALMILTFSRKR